MASRSPSTPPRMPSQAGIGMIHQHFMLVPTLTVAENVALGLKVQPRTVLDLDKVSARIRELSQVIRFES